MFSGLRQNSIFYILDKSNKPTLKVGQVVSVSNPMPKLATAPYTADTYVDVSVKVGDEQLEFKQLPSALSIANCNNVVVSESREAMLSEVEGMKRISQDALNSVEYHQGVVDACEDMIATLNPAIADKKATDERINAIEGRMGGIEDTLGKMMGMLSETLGKSSKNK